MASKHKACTAAESIRALSLGETYSKTSRLPIEDASQEEINLTLQKLRNTTNQGLSKIRAVTGRNFRSESGVMLTDDRAALLCTVAVTRFEGEDDEYEEIPEGEDDEAIDEPDI